MYVFGCIFIWLDVDLIDLLIVQLFSYLMDYLLI